MESVIILGAKGRFGRAAALAFRAAGWRVTELARNWPTPGPDRVDVDVMDRAALVAACTGHDVIVNTINPPYHEWAAVMTDITASVIAAAQATGATVLIPGNVYNYGTVMPATLRETSPWVGDTAKGAIRIRMEQAFQDSGVPTIVLRGGDFIEEAQAGGWFDTYMTPKVGAGKMTYPGRRDVMHAWAYLPDMARAAVGLAAQRARFDLYEEFGFAGYAMTGDDLATQVSQAVGRPVRVSPFPWFALRVMALWSPLMREVLEMRYLWNTPHAVDGTKLRAALPAYRDTPVAQAMAEVLVRHTGAHATAAALA